MCDERSAECTECHVVQLVTVESFPEYSNSGLEICSDCLPSCEGCGERRVVNEDGLCRDCQEREDRTVCSGCNGSGEGYTDGPKCFVCGGTGGKRKQNREEWV